MDGHRGGSGEWVEEAARAAAQPAGSGVDEQRADDRAAVVQRNALDAGTARTTGNQISTGELDPGETQPQRAGQGLDQVGKQLFAHRRGVAGGGQATADAGQDRVRVIVPAVDQAVDARAEQPVERRRSQRDAGDREERAAAEVDHGEVADECHREHQGPAQRTAQRQIGAPATEVLRGGQDGERQRKHGGGSEDRPEGEAQPEQCGGREQAEREPPALHDRDDGQHGRGHRECGHSDGQPQRRRGETGRVVQAGNRQAGAVDGVRHRRRLHRVREGRGGRRPPVRLPGRHEERHHEGEQRVPGPPRPVAHPQRGPGAVLRSADVHRVLRAGEADRLAQADREQQPADREPGPDGGQPGAGQPVGDRGGRAHEPPRHEVVVAGGVAVRDVQDDTGRGQSDGAEGTRFRC